MKWRDRQRQAYLKRRIEKAEKAESKPPGCALFALVIVLATLIVAMAGPDHGHPVYIPLVTSNFEVYASIPGGPEMTPVAP